MSKVVEVPGVGNVEFPDSMSDDDIGTAIKKNQPVASFKDQANQVVKDVASGAVSKLNPIPGIVDTAKAIYGDPIGVAMETLAHPYMALKRAKEAYDAGKIEEAFAHVNNALEGPAGAVTEGSEVKMATPGQRATGLGEMIGMGLQSYLGAKAPELLSAAKNKAVSVATANPAVARAALRIASPRLGAVADLAEALKPQEAPAAPAAPAAQPPALPENPPVYDDIAKSLGGKKYSALNESGQEAVRKVFDRMNAPQPSAPQTAPQPAVTVPPAPEPAVEPTTQTAAVPSVAPGGATATTVTPEVAADRQIVLDMAQKMKDSLAPSQDLSALSPEDKFQALRKSLVDKGDLPEKGTLGGKPARARFDEGGPSETVKPVKTVAIKEIAADSPLAKKLAAMTPEKRFETLQNMKKLADAMAK